MTIRSTRPSYAAPHAIVFVLLMNIGVVAAFKWNKVEGSPREDALAQAFAVADARLGLGSCGGSRAAVITPAAVVAAADSTRRASTVKR